MARHEAQVTDFDDCRALLIAYRSRDVRPVLLLRIGPGSGTLRLNGLEARTRQLSRGEIFPHLSLPSSRLGMHPPPVRRRRKALCFEPLARSAALIEGSACEGEAGTSHECPLVSCGHRPLRWQVL